MPIKKNNIPGWQQKEVIKRLKELNANPGTAVSYNRVKKKIRASLKTSA